MLLPGLLHKGAADAPAWDWEIGLGVLPAWPGVRAAGGKSSSQKLSYGRNAKLASTIAPGWFFYTYLFTFHCCQRVLIVRSIIRVQEMGKLG